MPTSLKASTAKKRSKAPKVAPSFPVYGAKYAHMINLVAIDIHNGERTSAAGVFIPSTIYAAELEHRTAVVSALSQLAEDLLAAPGPIQIQLVEPTKGLPLSVALDVLYVMRSVAVAE